MKTNWPTKKLGEVCNFKIIKNIELLPYVGMENVESNTGLFIGSKEPRAVKSVTAHFNEDCVLYGKLRPYLNKVFVPDFEGHSSTEFIPLRPNLKILTREWLAKWLGNDSVIRAVSLNTTGSRMPRANLNHLKNLEIPLPPIEEQKRIVARVEGLMARVKEAKRLRGEAIEAAQTLLSAELSRIFEEGKKKGWEEKELGSICYLNPKKSEIKGLADDLVVSFVPMSAVNEFTQRITTFAEKKLGSVKKGYTYFRDGDVLFAKITPCMENGKVAIAKNLKNGIGFGTTEFHVIRPNKYVLAEWIYYIIRQPFFRTAAKQRMTGSAGQKRVPIKFLESYKILLPSIGEQQKIVARLDSLSEKIREVGEYQKSTQSDLLALEQSILHQAFSGKL